MMTPASLRTNQYSQLQRLNALEDQIKRAKSATNETAIVGDFNLCMDKWNEKTYQWKTLSDYWINVLKENGLKYEEMGTTYESFYTLKNGNKVKSALDHVYHTNNSIFKESRKLQNSMSDH